MVLRESHESRVCGWKRNDSNRGDWLDATQVHGREGGGRMPAHAVEVRGDGRHEDGRWEEHGVVLHYVGRLRLAHLKHGDAEQLLGI